MNSNGCCPSDVFSNTRPGITDPKVNDRDVRHELDLAFGARWPAICDGPSATQWRKAETTLNSLSIVRPQSRFRDATTSGADRSSNGEQTDLIASVISVMDKKPPLQ